MRDLLRRILTRLGLSRVAGPSAPPPAVDPPLQEASILVRAGEIAREDGRRQEALSFYGRAIDSYLQAGLTRKAEALCRRVIDLEPKVIRTRYTLAAIAVGRDDVREARRRLADYTVAVTLANAAGTAVGPLVELAGSTANPTMRALVAEALRRADRPDLADGVEAGIIAPAPRTSWSRALGAALQVPGAVGTDRAR